MTAKLVAFLLSFLLRFLIEKKLDSHFMKSPYLLTPIFLLNIFNLDKLELVFSNISVIKELHSTLKLYLENVDFILPQTTSTVQNHKIALHFKMLCKSKATLPRSQLNQPSLIMLVNFFSELSYKPPLKIGPAYLSADHK